MCSNLFQNEVFLDYLGTVRHIWKGHLSKVGHNARDRDPGMRAAQWWADSQKLQAKKRAASLTESSAKGARSSYGDKPGTSSQATLCFAFPCNCFKADSANNYSVYRPRACVAIIYQMRAAVLIVGLRRPVRRITPPCNQTLVLFCLGWLGLNSSSLLWLICVLVDVLFCLDCFQCLSYGIVWSGSVLVGWASCCFVLAFVC